MLSSPTPFKTCHLRSDAPIFRISFLLLLREIARLSAYLRRLTPRVRQRRVWRPFGVTANYAPLSTSPPSADGWSLKKPKDKVKKSTTKKTSKKGFYFFSVRAPRSQVARGNFGFCGKVASLLIAFSFWGIQGYPLFPKPFFKLLAPITSASLWFPLFPCSFWSKCPQKA